MKKSLVVFSVCAALTSIMAYADSTSPAPTKKRKSKQRTQLVVASPKPAPVEPEVKVEPDRYPWTKNFSGTAAFVSNYMFRGISQSRNLPAAQTGLTYTTPINIYFSVWGSNVNFPGTTATVEIDTVIGYNNTYGDHFAYDVSVARYHYNGTSYFNYNELLGVASFYFLQANFGYTANYNNTHTNGTYYGGGINYNIPSKYAFGVCDVNITALMGHYSLTRLGGNSYNDYSVQLKKTFNNYTASVQWTNTDGRQHIQPYDSAQVVGQIAASF